MGDITLGTILQAWHHRSRYRVLQRVQQKQAREAKQQRFQQLCQEVDVAARHHDSHSMFHIINKFTPKRPQARARIRGPDGRIADQFLAHSMTVADEDTGFQNFCNHSGLAGDGHSFSKLRTI